EAFARFARQLCRADYGCLCGLLHEWRGRVGGNLRCSPDSSWIEQDFVGAFIDRELEKLSVFDKERPALRERRFETGDVDLGWIRFDLTKIGVHREVEGEAVADADLCIDPGAPLEGTRPVEWIGAFAGSAAHAGAYIWYGLSAARGSK